VVVGVAWVQTGFAGSAVVWLAVLEFRHGVGSVNVGLSWGSAGGGFLGMAGVLLLLCCCCCCWGAVQAGVAYRLG
jgi:hypothetical protein